MNVNTVNGIMYNMNQPIVLRIFTSNHPKCM